MTNEQSYDVVIIGGGMVGVSLALALPEALRVAVVESFAIPDSSAQYQPSFDARATAISKSTELFFEQAGVWQKVVAYAEQIKDVHVSDKNHWGSVLLSDAKENLDGLGYVIENACLGKALLEVLRQRENVVYLCPATVNGIKVKAGSCDLSLSYESVELMLSAQLAIVADGANSSMCKKLGVEINTNHYQQKALVANVATDAPHHGVAYERFTKTGPMALLPLPGVDDYANRSGLVWTMPEGQADELMALPDEAFLKELQQRFGNRQGEFLHVGKRHCYPLALSSAAEQVRERIVVLGNAAHSLHPVAGQGFNLAVRDVAALVASIDQALALGDRYYSFDVLNAYLEKQKRDQWLTIAFSDILPQIFTSKHYAVKAARGFGLLALELTPAFKKNFVRFATGFRKASSASSS